VAQAADLIRNLTPAEQQDANKVPAGTLRDPQTLAERTKEGKTMLLALSFLRQFNAAHVGHAHIRN
jgi:ubiquinol-cytochrome c reductase iron-sulfur subunit